MKKSILLLVLLITIISTSIINVNADNYKMRELIPLDEKTTIRADSLLYKDVSYKKGKIVIGSIKNISNEKKPITISVGLFDKNRRNILVINYCSDEDFLDPKGVYDDYVIDIDESIFDDNVSISDIKYISVLSENSHCRLGGEKEFVGKRVNDMYIFFSGELPQSVKLLLNIVKVVIVLLVALFLYKFLFTNAYRNMDGDDVRKEFKYRNKQNAKKREEELKRNPPKPKEKKKTKTDKVLEQEKLEKEKEHKDHSDLHNFYK